MTAPALLLLDAALKSALLLAVTFGLTRLLRRGPALTRQALWATALVGSVLMPLLSLAIPSWTLAELPAPFFSPSSGSAPTVQTEVPAPGSATAPRPAIPVAETQLRSPSPTPSRAHADLFAVKLETGRRWIASRSVPFWIGAAWLTGLCAALGCQGVGLWRARQITRRGRPAAGDWEGDLAAVRRQLGSGRRVELLLSRQVASPLTWGLWRPVVLLPESARGWSAERRAIVLQHELVHVRRLDWAIRMLARSACAVYWFNPLAWMAARRLALEQETACDEEVLSLGTRPSTYAEHLLAIARSVGRGPRPALPAVDMAWRSQMEGRLMHILDRNRPRPLGRIVLVPAVVFLSALVPALAAMRAWDDSPEPRVAAAVPALATDAATDAEPADATPRLQQLVQRLSGLEQQLEPMEGDLQTLEGRLEPIEEDLERLEEQMRPIEAGLESYEMKLQPYEGRLAEIEAELEPGQEQLQEIEREMEPLEQDLEALERELEPFERELESLEAERRPFESRLSQIEAELEPLHQKLDELSDRLEVEVEKEPRDQGAIDAIHDEINRVHEQMAPLHDQLSAVHEEMTPLHEEMRKTHEAMAPVHQRMSAIHEAMRPFHERMRAVHESLRPIFDSLHGVHEEMGPVHAQMSQVHDEMAPFHDQMRQHFERMEPVHAEMRAVHERMRPIHEEMGRVHEELRGELRSAVAVILRNELEPVVAADAPFEQAASFALDAVGIRVHHGVLSFRSSPAELHQRLTEIFTPARRGDEAAFSEAIVRAAEAVARFEVRVPSTL